VNVVEAAAVPREIWRPLYLRDAAISVVGSVLLALLVMWLVELFNRADPQPTMLVAQPMPYPVGGGLLPGAYGDRPALAGGYAPALAGGPSALLPSAPPVPRELVPDEVRSLLAAASHEVRIAALLLLSGLGPAEILALRWDDVDLATRQIRVSGDTARSIEIVEPLLGLLQRSPRGSDGRVLAAAGEAAPTVETLASQLLYAAHDGGLDRAAEVTPDALWHTGVAFLARQGIRLAELAKVAGRLSADQAATYSALAPAGTRVSLAEVRSILDLVREPNTA
jgi:hypothetical protein